MTLNLPFEVLYILFVLQEGGFEAFIVGGAVRDLIINSTNKKNQFISDFDFATNATPEQIQEIFIESFYENEFGMVGVAHKHLLEQIETLQFLPKENMETELNNRKTQPKDRIIDFAKSTKLHKSLTQPLAIDQQPLAIHPFEITTYRSESSYKDFRRPEAVSWGKSINEDLKRRDFTVNAIAISVDQTKLKKIFNQKLNSSYDFTIANYKLVDPYQGLSDITASKIKTVGQAELRFQEDALRLLRAIRLAVQLDFEIEPETFAEITANSQLIKHISWERISDEFIKILQSDNPTLGINLLDQTNLIGHILPELLITKNIKQGGHHNTDVWTHSLDSLANCPSDDPIVRLATLIHDIAKPQTAKEIKGQITNYSHEVIGARTAVQVAKRLRLSKKDQQRLFILVRYHMFYYQPTHTDASIRRFMRKAGLNNLDDLLALREGDRLGSGAKKTSWRLEEMKKRMIEQLHQPMEITDLAINGHDLIKKFKLKPGKQIGEVLNKLFELVMEKPSLNTKERLFTKAQELLQSHP